jgi:serine/threonine protein kinase
MTPDPVLIHDGRWDRISALFETALSLSPDERGQFIESTCGSDPALRTELQSLLAAHADAPRFLDRFYARVVQPALFDDPPSPALPDGSVTTAARHRIRTGDQIRHFTVLEQLGSGGSGIVFRGRDTVLQRDVAIKVLTSGNSDVAADHVRLIREAQAASQLDDPHVCPIYAIETSADGDLCIVMAYCVGGTLRERLRAGPLPLNVVSTVATHLARGLARAHTAGIVHGDIKPANVGFGEGDVARLLDFGVATHTQQDDTTRARGVAGTLPYLAPELWRGEPRSPRADVWALGVTFYEMLTGRRPFNSSDPTVLAESIRAGVLPPVVRPDGAAVPPHLAQLVHAMLRGDPSARPADGIAVLAALSRASDVSVPADTAGTDESTGGGITRVATRPPVTIRTTIIGGLVAAGVLALAARAISSRPAQRNTSAPPIEVARTSQPLSTIAILPFATRGSRDIAYLSDGMVDLLTPAFDATGLVRGVDPNTVLGASGNRRDATLDSSAARAIATQVRADRYVVGSIVSTGVSMVFRATLRRNDGREIGRAQTTVSDSTQLVAGVDALVRQLIATELLAPGDTVAGIAAATTRSTSALRAYLNGERELRDARPAAAITQFQSAVAADSTFALAWYRLARAARWSDVDSLSASAAQRAAELTNSLPDRQRAIVRAYATLRAGSPLQAERELTAIVTDHPTDVEAWMLLGELQFTNNPYHGRSIAEAGRAFQRVMDLDMRNREVTVYLMELAALADRRGQLDTLYRMYFSPNSAGEQPGIRAAYTALHRARLGAARTQIPTIDQPAQARVALRRISSDARDRVLAQQYAVTLANAAETRVEGLLALATLDIARGAWSDATARWSLASPLNAATTAEHRALSALAPSVTVSADTLRAIRRELQTVDAVARTSSAGLTAAEREDVRSYLAGVLSVRLGDAAGVTTARAALAARRASQSRIASALKHAIDGHELLQRRDHGGALAAFEASGIAIPARTRNAHPALEQQVDRLARATALRELQRSADAQRWYTSLREGFGVHVIPFAAAADSGVRSTAAPQRTEGPSP